MAHASEKQASETAVQVMLDGLPVELPGHTQISLNEIFAYLEQLAVRKERVLSTVAVDGATVKSPGSGSAYSGAAYANFHQVEASTISFVELGRHVVSSALSQVRSLLGRVEAAQILVLINDWPVIDRIWSDIVPDFKNPMLGLSFLQELWGERMDRMKINGRSLAEHWDQVGTIQAELEIILGRRQEVLEFSDVLERRLMAWLRQIYQCLNRLEEETRPSC